MDTTRVLRLFHRLLTPSTRLRVLLCLGAAMTLFLATGATRVSADDPTFLAHHSFGTGHDDTHR